MSDKSAESLVAAVVATQWLRWPMSQSVLQQDSLVTPNRILTTLAVPPHLPHVHQVSPSTSANHLCHVQLCGHHTWLGVVLDIPDTLPAGRLIDRWVGEPTRAVVLHTSAFLSNAKGYPVLSRAHQELITTCFQK